MSDFETREEFEALDDEYRKQIGLVGVMLASENQRISDSLALREKSSTLFDHSVMFDDDDNDDSADVESLIDLMTTRTFDVSVTNALTDIVDPLIYQSELNSIEEREQSLLIAQTQNRLLHRINTNLINIRGAQENLFGRLVRDIREIRDNPAWFAMTMLERSLSAGAGLIGSLLFGSRKQEDGYDRIVTSIKEQTEFQMTGQIDRQQSLFERFIDKGLVGGAVATAFDKTTNVLGIGREAARERTINQAQGIEDKSIGGKIAGALFGSEYAVGNILTQNDQYQDNSTDLLGMIEKNTRNIYESNLMSLGFEGQLMRYQETLLESSNTLIDITEANTEHNKKSLAEQIRTRRLMQLKALLGFIGKMSMGVLSMVGSMGTLVAGVTKLAPVASILTKLTGLFTAKHMAGSMLPSPDFETGGRRKGGVLSRGKGLFGKAKGFLGGLDYKGLAGKAALPLAGLAAWMNKDEELERRPDLTDNQKTAIKTGSALGSMGGVWGGAALGASLGSVIPVFGTAIGGALGGIAGGILGEEVGSFFGEYLSGFFDEKPILDTIKDTTNMFIGDFAKATSSMIGVIDETTGIGDMINTLGDKTNEFFSDMFDSNITFDSVMNGAKEKTENFFSTMFDSDITFGSVVNDIREQSKSLLDGWFGSDETTNPNEVVNEPSWMDTASEWFSGSDTTTPATSVDGSDGGTSLTEKIVRIIKETETTTQNNTEMQGSNVELQEKTNSTLDTLNGLIREMLASSKEVNMTAPFEPKVDDRDFLTITGR